MGNDRGVYVAFVFGAKGAGEYDGLTGVSGGDVGGEVGGGEMGGDAIVERGEW